MYNNFNKLTLILLIVISIVSCSPSPQQKSAKHEQPVSVRIGAFLGLSGDIVAYGMAQKQGIELAVQEINDSKYLGTGKEFKVILVDAGDTAESAIAAIKKLIIEEKVSGIIGPTLSSQAFPANPIAQKNGIPVIAVSNTVPKITFLGDYIFRCSLPESTVIFGTIKAAASRLGVIKVGILWGKDDDYTVAGYQAFDDAVNKSGLKIIADETFARGNTDFRHQLTKIIATNPDAILVSSLAKEAALIIIQTRELSYPGIIIGGNGFNSQDIIKQAGVDAEGVMAGTAWNIASTNPRNLEFISAFQKTYGNKPDQFATQAYTGAWLFANAIRTAGSAEPKAIRDALAGISNFTTPLGSFSFDVLREPVYPAIVQIVKNGKFTVFNP